MPSAFSDPRLVLGGGPGEHPDLVPGQTLRLFGPSLRIIRPAPSTEVWIEEIHLLASRSV